MTKWIILTVGALILMTGSIATADIGNKQIIKTQNNYSMNRPVYELELSRWGVYNDGTHPLETTNGINAALKWAKKNNYKTFKIPDGTYLIAKGTKQDDPDARINLVSDMDFLLSKNTVLQKETNQFEIYSVLYLGPNVQSVTVKGGTYRGDRDTHDFSKKGPDTGGTHEWGYGIQVAGAENIVIDDVKLEKFTGDGIIVTATTVTGSTISEESLEIGGINDEGTPVEAEGKIRTNNRAVTHFENASYEKYRNIYFWLPEGINSGSKADVYYYRKDGSFIRADKQIRFYSGESVFPKDADYFRAVFEAPSIKKVKISRMTVDISKNVTIKNSDIGYNRRQGISLVGSDGVKIYNNHIHHTGGTAPQSGLDIEPGFFPGRDTIIKDNHFTDNKIQIVLAYGENAVIEGNHFEQSLEGAVGVHVHKGFRGDVIVKENTFNGSGLTVNSENAIVDQNKFTKSEVKLLGKNISFSNATMANAMLNIGYKEGQKIENIEMKQSGANLGALFIWDAPVHMKDVTIHANSKNKGIIQGAGNNKSVYDDLVVKGEKYNGTILPAGEYNRCTFEAGTLEINREGKYVLNECTVKNPSSLFNVNNLYGNPEVTIKDSLLEVTENIGYGAAIYVQGAGKFELFNNEIMAKNNTENTPLIKLGPYGSSKPTKIFNALIKGNEIHTKTAISGVHTLNAGTDAPAYGVTDNKLFNATLELTSKEINEENKLITK
ncbi:parallel beta helix pectate lyase-like protein [Cytobacillus firmus]|uniref:Parallel beta helix pectate lyase-like protein n=3 Tax=Bacillaceae TaxID=186817 RepID=A0A366JMC3_CYTFI|nr:parallel beta helix pectate lyase-like protein [Cytobacillus firmus]TDX38340.1 parallel beta helix pectate lyase-like protein [Cytobacillus oceanisediminis]